MRQSLIIATLAVVIIGGLLTYYLFGTNRNMTNSNMPVIEVDKDGIVAIEGKIVPIDKVGSSPMKYAIKLENGAQWIFIDSLYNILLDGLIEVERGKGFEPIFVGHGKLVRVEEGNLHDESIVTPKSGPESYMLTDAEFYIKNNGITATLDSMVGLGGIDDRGFQEVKYVVPNGVGWWNANGMPGKFYLDTKSSSYSKLLDSLKTPPNNFGGLRLIVSPISIVNGMNRGTLSVDPQAVSRYVIVDVLFDIPGYL